MAIKLYDLAGANPDSRFSPNCWRVRMALAHKGLETETIAWRFTDKDMIAFSDQGKTPVIVDGERTVIDSWAIAEYLDETYPDRPMLLDGAQSKAHAFFIKTWTERVVHSGVIKQVLLPLFAQLAEQDKAHFRTTRETMFKCTLEEFGSDSAAALPGFRAALTPLRATLADQKFLGGDTPSFADYIVFGAFQWARVTSTQDILEAGDTLAEWRQSMLDLYEGLAAKTPARAA